MVVRLDEPPAVSGKRLVIQSGGTGYRNALHATSQARGLEGAHGVRMLQQVRADQRLVGGIS